MHELTQNNRRFTLNQPRILRNPITVKELRSRMRGRRAFFVLTIYLAMMSALILLVYLAYGAATGGGIGTSNRQAGKAVFAAVLAVQVVLVIFIGPAFTAGTIVGEKERRTYDLLRTTLLPARSLINGKLTSALSYVLLLILVSIPLQSIAFLLGGISPIELLFSQLLIIISAVTFALIGLYFSTIMRSTLAASLTTYSVALILTLGAPIFASLVFALLGPVLFGPTSPGWVTQTMLIYGGLILAATNLPAALVVSDVFLVQEDALIYFIEFIDGRAIPIFSPWFLFVIFYILLAFILYWVCIRNVRKIAQK